MIFPKNKAFIDGLKRFLRPEQWLLDEPLSRHTTFQIGGPADYFVLPDSMREVVDVLALVRAHRLPLTILGNGSNVLVLDGGVRGVVLSLGGGMRRMRREGELVRAGAGALLSDVSRYAAAHDLTGMEFAVGIPGSIGGAVFMNAGAYDGEMSDIVAAATAVGMDGGVHRFVNGELAFSYRHSAFQSNRHIICEVELALKQGEPLVIRSKMGDFTFKRAMKQPVEMPSAGSTFKRPPGYYAGTLIEKTGLKGLQVGGAQVSLKHAGFIVNSGGATAKDVLNLIREVQRRVEEAHGVRLHPEVRTMGEE